MSSVSRYTFRFVILTAALTCLLPSGVFAQQVFGSIYGTVTDPSGGGVPNAKVTVTDQSKQTSTQVQTNESGNYTQGHLIPGTYTVDIEGAGFRKSEFKDIVVQVDNAARVDAKLDVGNVSETVEVTAAAPTLQSDRADVQTTFTAKQLIDLPSNGRNAQAYELLAPGTSRIGFNHASSEDPQGSVQIEVNGQHFSGTGYQLDGTENQDPILGIIVINPNIDSLNETKISAQDYDAEFGYAGAGIQNSSTKSGQNRIHATAFEYLQNNSPNFQDFGRNPFSEPNGPAPFKQNQFGGSIGGAVIKDKFFYFGDAELLRQRQNASVLTTVPTLAARNGDFSQYLALGGSQYAIYDPLTGDTNPNSPTNGQNRTQFQSNGVLNVIPASRITPQAQALLAYFPLPNTVTAGLPFLNNYATGAGLSFDANKWDTREDYYMNEKTSIFGRYSDQQFAKSAVGAFGYEAGGPVNNSTNFAGQSHVHNHSVSIGITHTFNPTLVNDFRFGYMRYHVQTEPNGEATSPATTAGIPGVNLDNTYTGGLPYFNFSGSGTSLGYALGANQCNCPLTQQEGQYQFTDNITKIVGNHSFKFGTDIRYAKNLRVPSDSHRAGEFTLSGGQTGLVQANSTTGASSSVIDGIDFASLELGLVNSFNRYVSTSTDAAEHQRRWFFYGQDQYRVTPKLSITYGLRWELIFPEEVNAAGNGAQLDLRTGLINVFGVGNVSVHGVQSMNYLNFAPRLGIAYQLNSKTVIRTGYGWAYELGTFGATFGHNVTQNPPVLTNQQLNPANGWSSVFTLAQGPAAPTTIAVNPSTGQFLLPDGINAKARPLDVRLPRVMAYNFTVERQIAPNTSLSVGYVGNSGRHVGPGSGDGFNVNVNQAAYIPADASNQNLAKPYYAKYGWTQGIDLYCQCLNNQYNSLQVQLKRTFSTGYSTQVSYTWQDAEGESSNAYDILYARKYGYGRENAIADHELVISQNYSIPFGRGRKYGANINKMVDYVAGGWNISGVTSFYSGLPFTPSIGSFPNGYVAPYTGDNRPSVGTGSPYASNQNRSDWLNTASGTNLSGAFVLPAAQTFGTYGYNTLRGPIFINQDATISKSFAITERLNWTLRGEAYNLFNHANLGLPNSNVNGSNPGQITGLAYGYNMRRLQFAARFDF